MANDNKEETTAQNVHIKTQHVQHGGEMNYPEKQKMERLGGLGVSVGGLHFAALEVFV